MSDANHLPTPGAIIQGAVPPSDLDAEGYVLCYVLLESGDLDRCIATGLQAIHFFADANRRIWESILRVNVEAGMHVDLTSVAGDLRSLGRLDQIGGTPYLAQLTGYPVESRPGVLEQHCRTIITHWTARQVISAAQVTAATLYFPKGVPTQSIIEAHEQQVWELAHQNREGGYEPAGAIAGRSLNELAAALRDGKTLLGATTGFDDLDKKTTGYHAGDLIIIAARPGIGKTSFACSSILQIAKPPREGEGLPQAVYLHSCEMPKDQIALRLVCSLAGIEFQRLRLNQLDRPAWDQLFKAAKDLSARPILIDDKPAVTVAELRSNIRKIRREIELGRIQATHLAIACVDYLQLMSGEKGAGREREISSISQGLKNTAKTEKICMVALAQLNREVEKGAGKGGKRPMLSHLRESGSLEQDADAVWFLYREAYYDSSANNEAEVIIAKQRSGPTCTVILTFDGATTTFRPLAKGYEDFNDFGDEAETRAPQLPPPPDDDAWYNR